MYLYIFPAVFVSLRSVIMAELLGIEKLATSFGLVTMCQGLAAFIGPPIAGLYNTFITDSTIKFEAVSSTRSYLAFYIV